MPFLLNMDDFSVTVQLGREGGVCSAILPKTFEPLGYNNCFIKI